MPKSALLAFVTILAIALPASTAPKRRAVRHPSPETLPVAVGDRYENAQGTSLAVPAPGVLVNDTLNQSVIASYGATTGAEQTVVGTATVTSQGGTVTLRSDGSLLFIAGPGFTGTDSFRYTLRNGSGTASADVIITVTPTPPLAVNDAFTTPQDKTLSAQPAALFANDSLNGAALVSYGASTGTEQTTVGGVTPTSAGGTVRVDADGSFVYNPGSGFSGSDGFKYVLQNAGGSSTGTVTITVQSSVPDFTVTSPGFFYSFSGVSGQNPVITLTRGRTYTFQINADSIHPFEILDAPAGSVTNNNIFDGVITFTVPTTAKNYRYRCSIHAFGNAINTVP